MLMCSDIDYLLNVLDGGIGEGNGVFLFIVSLFINFLRRDDDEFLGSNSFFCNRGLGYFGYLILL